LYHLINHAFYKGLLFLGAGSIIHSMSDNQDLRKYGGLILFLPLAYSIMLIASFSLMAIPFLSGYYSKDLIIESLYSQHSFVSTSVYIISILGAILTTLYSAKILYMTFISKPKGSYVSYMNVHEGNVFMNVPLIILAIFSIFFGYITKDIYIGLGSNVFSDNSIFVHPLHEILIDTEFSFSIGDKVNLLKFVPFISVVTFLILYVIANEYLNPKFTIININKLGYYTYGLFSQRLFFEFIYNSYIIKGVLILGGHTTKVLDKGGIELIGPVGIEKILFSISKQVTNLSKGIVTNYALYLIIYAILYILIYSLFIYFLQLFFVVMYIYIMIFQQKKLE
jgi:NADH-ubiquinone oxidoreductase chain 5